MDEESFKVKMEGENEGFTIDWGQRVTSLYPLNSQKHSESSENASPVKERNRYPRQIGLHLYFCSLHVVPLTFLPSFLSPFLLSGSAGAVCCMSGSHQVNSRRPLLPAISNQPCGCPLTRADRWRSHYPLLQPNQLCWKWQPNAIVDNDVCLLWFEVMCPRIALFLVALSLSLSCTPTSTTPSPKYK